MLRLLKSAAPPAAGANQQQKSYQVNEDESPLSFIRPTKQQESSNEKNLNELITEYLTLGEYTPKTLKQYEQSMKLLRRANLTLDDFNNPTTAQEKFVSAVFKPQWAKRTVASHLLRFCSFGNWLTNNHFAQGRHRPLVRLSRRPQVREIPTDIEVNILLKSLEERATLATTRPNRQRAYEKDLLITSLLVETGARISEAIHLRKEDLIQREERSAIYLRGSKSEAAERAVMITNSLREKIEVYCARWNLAGEIFISRTGKRIEERSFATWLSSYCEKLNLSCHVSPHTFRYRYILKLIERGSSALEVMTRVGHTDIEMTVYYFNQVRRLMPWVEVNGDVAILERRRQFWVDRSKGETK